MCGYVSQSLYQAVNRARAARSAAAAEAAGRTFRVVSVTKKGKQNPIALPFYNHLTAELAAERLAYLQGLNPGREYAVAQH